MLSSRWSGWLLGVALVSGAQDVQAQTSASPPSAAFPVDPPPAAPAAPPAQASPPPPAPPPPTPPPPALPAPSPRPSPLPTHVASSTPVTEDEPEVDPPFVPTAPLRFGLAGQLALSSALGLSLTSTTYSRSDASILQIEVYPTADYFVIERLSLGAFVFITHRSDAVPAGDVTLDRERTAFGGGLRVGFNLPFNELFSAWLTGGFWGAKLHTEEPTVTVSFNGTNVLGISTTNHGIFGLNAFLPILAHPAPHFFLGLGPMLNAELVHGTAGHEATTVGLSSILGGWL